MSEENKVFGWWNNRACVYSDTAKKDIVIGQLPNKGDASTHGYIRYLSFAGEKISLQVGPVMDGADKVTHYDIPPEVANAAIEAAMGYINFWLLGEEARKA